MKRARDQVCPRCMAKGAHAMGCTEPAIKRARDHLGALVHTKPQILADALAGMQPADRQVLLEALRGAS